ncbi:Endoribonuclease YbeY [Dissophora ornata]|nr:Endoribonuclease YbeY [Dissophora ornata]
MILLKNTQSILKLPSRSVKTQIQLLLTAAGYRDWDIGVCLTGDKAIRQLNAEYRGKDRSTDILSFPFAEAVKPGILPTPTSEDDKNLGDIFISVRYVNQWCKDHNVDIHDRLPVLYAHGICHLLGYDHQDNKDYVVMKRRENNILKKMRNWEAALESK